METDRAAICRLRVFVGKWRAPPNEPRCRFFCIGQLRVGRSQPQGGGGECGSVEHRQSRRLKVVLDGQDSINIALEIQVIRDISLRELQRILRQDQVAYHARVLENQRELGSMSTDGERGTARKTRREAAGIALEQPSKDLLFVCCRGG